MKKKVLRRMTKASKIPLEGVQTISLELHRRFSLRGDSDGGDLGSCEIAAAAVEIRRRQMARLQRDPRFELPEEMPRYA